MAVTVFSARTRAEAWIAAVQFLQNQHGWEAFNVILEVAAPSDHSDRANAIEAIANTFLERNGVGNLHTVAETIFPGWLYTHEGAKGVYETYPETIFPALAKRRDTRWGTYAYRLVRWRGPDGRTTNPLQQCVAKMRAERQSGAAKRSCYELSTYDPRHDGARRMGGPCLSHLSFKLGTDGTVCLTALYRNHYYVERALGNLLGLARLQQFVAEQVGCTVGFLVCHSTLATLDHGTRWGRRAVSTLVQECLARGSGNAELRVPREALSRRNRV